MKNDNKGYVCPNCGERHTLALTTTASAQFKIHDNGTMGDVITDDTGIDYINETASLESDNVEFHCRNCNSSFEAIPEDNAGQLMWNVGNEI